MASGSVLNEEHYYGSLEIRRPGLDVPDDARSNCSHMSHASCQTGPSQVIYPRANEPAQEPVRMVLIPLRARETDGAGPLGQPVTNYYTKISVGTPPQTFRVQFDLALDNHFLPHYSWQPWRNALKYKLGYKASKSQTSVKHSGTYYTMSYQNCDFLGRLNEDNVKLESYTRYKEKTNIVYRSSPVGLRLNFLAIDMLNRPHFAKLPIHGMLALGPSYESDKIGCKNLLAKMLDESLVDKAFMSLWFNAKLMKGELLMGGTDPKRFKGSIHWHGSERHRWTIQLRSVRIGNVTIDQNLPCTATLSSAINEIHAPISVVERIYGQFQVRQDPKTGIAWIHGDNFARLPDIEISTEKLDITLESGSYLGRQKGRYYLQLVAGASDREWILGTCFLQNIYSVFDLTNHMVGFARHRNTPIENVKSRS